MLIFKIVKFVITLPFRLLKLPFGILSTLMGLAFGLLKFALKAFVLLGVVFKLAILPLKVVGGLGKIAFRLVRMPFRIIF